MAWSRWLRCICSIALVLHVTSLQVADEHAVHAIKSLIPDAGAGAFNSHEESNHMATPLQKTHAIASVEALPSHTHLGLALPGKQRAQAVTEEAEGNSNGYEQMDYVYLEEDQQISAYKQLVADAVIAAQGDHESAGHEFSDEQIASYKQMVADAVAAAEHEQKIESYRQMAADASEAATAAEAEEMASVGSEEFAAGTVEDSPVDTLFLSELPAGTPLPSTSSVISMANIIASTAWKALQHVETTALQQWRQASQLRLEEFRVVVEQGSSSTAATQAPMTGSSSSSLTTKGDGVEVSVTVESSTPRPVLSLLQRWTHKQEAAEDSLDAAAIAAAVFRALGQHTAEQLQRVKNDQTTQEMIQEIQKTGSLKRAFRSKDELSATTAAAVVAAANALATDPWDTMEMEVEVTSSVQNGAMTWVHVALIVIVTVLTHMGVFLLISPWIANLMGHDDEDTESDEKQQQFISAGLAEAGLYKRLLPANTEYVGQGH